MRANIPPTDPHSTFIKGKTTPPRRQRGGNGGTHLHVTPRAKITYAGTTEQDKLHSSGSKPDVTVHLEKLPSEALTVALELKEQIRMRVLGKAGSDSGGVNNYVS